jgi:hypothetical protein
MRKIWSQPLSWLAAGGLACIISACGGGGGGSTTATANPDSNTPTENAAPDTTPPQVTSYSPSTATSVSRHSEISATFNEALQAGSVTGANFQVTRSGVSVPGALSYEASSNKATFVPEDPLDVLASFRATVTTGVKDAAGNGLVADQSWNFKTQDGTWRIAELFDPITAKSLKPAVAIHADGHAVAVWSTETSAGAYAIRASVHSSATGWGTVQTISAAGAFDAHYPKIKFDSQGNGLVVWTQTGGGGTGYSIWSARLLKNGGWQAPVMVDDLLLNIQEVALAMDGNGNAFVAWSKNVGPGLTGNADIWAARFTPVGGWQTSSRLGNNTNTSGFGDAQQPQVAFDGNGNAYALWMQSSGAAPIWFAKYQASGGWQTAVSIGAASIGSTYAPALAVSSTGQALALWNSFVYAGGPYRFDVWSSYLSSSTSTWTVPQLVETDDAGDAYRQAVAVDSNGNFHVVWQQFASTYSSDIRYRQYTPQSGWGAGSTINTSSGTFDQNGWPSIVADRNGNLMAIWGVYGSGLAGAGEGTFARRYAAGEGWQSPVRINQAGSGHTFDTALAVSANGSIASAWIQPTPFRSDGPIWANVLR